MPIINSDALINCIAPGTSDLITSAVQTQRAAVGSGDSGYQTDTDVSYSSIPAGGKLYWRPARSSDSPTDGKSELYAIANSILADAFPRSQILSGTGSYSFASAATLKFGVSYGSMGFWASDTFMADVASGARTIDSGIAGEVWPEGNALFRANSLTISGNSNTTVATGITLSPNSVTPNAVAGTIIGTLQATPDTAVGGSFTKQAGDVDLVVVGNEVQIASGQQAPASGTLSITVRHDNTSGGGGVYDEVLTVSVTTVNSTVTQLGRWTPTTAQPVPVPGAPGGTYGPFSVSNGLATWASVPITAGTYQIGDHQIVVSGEAKTIAHIQDSYAVSAGGWDSGSDVELVLDRNAIRRSMSWLPDNNGVDIKNNPPSGCYYDAGNKYIVVTSAFAGKTLSGYYFDDCTLYIEPGANNVTIEQNYMDLKVRDTHFTSAFECRATGIRIRENVYDQPWDFGFPNAIIRSTSTGSTVLVERNWIGKHCGDFYKPHQRSENQVIKDNYIGPGSATTGKFVGQPLFQYEWESGRTYNKDEYFKNPNKTTGNRGGWFVSKNDNNLNNPIPTGRFSNAAWQFRDPHSDALQTAILNGFLHLVGNIIDYQQIDVAGYGPYASCEFVNILRLINKESNPGVTSGTITTEDNILLRRVYNNFVRKPPIECYKENAGDYWAPNSFTFRRNIIGPDDWDAADPETSIRRFYSSLDSAVGVWSGNLCASNCRLITVSP